ncbi:glycoside hydrolase [Thermocladium modestius]|uniref:Glycoside hydrolase n=1 Tax=Thermocladium modestius TaxID=62609 RepID=A0A830GVT9_9CREN|nr:glycoside hydrolase family 15 protein [Thermocladium modestius]GGP21339.1 glycoside hydrolase [Thermocladium modestius]
MSIKLSRTALISNMMTSALIADLDVVWFPAPRLDSPSVFARLLDEERGGHWGIAFDGEVVSTRYVAGTNVLETRVRAGEGEVRVLDFMPIGMPAIMRIVEAPSGLAYETVFDPAMRYGLVKPYRLDSKNGAQFVNPLNKELMEFIVLEGNCSPLGGNAWRCRGPAKFIGHYARSVGNSILGGGKSIVYSMLGEALDKVLEFWRVKEVKGGAGLRSSSIVLLLSMIHRSTGGIAASPTTSLPEIVGESRNWDYRFIWVRDSSLAAKALMQEGYLVDGRGAMNFLLSVVEPTAKPFDHPFYGVDGSPPGDEEELPWLAGYGGSRPVRVGNAASTQLQLDVEGWFMDALHTYYSLTGDDVYIRNYWWVVEATAEWCSKSYALPDAGMWEERGEARHYTHSKVMMWVALDRAAKLASGVGFREEGDEWRGRAGEVRQYVLANQPRMFTKYFGSSEVDSALLVLPLYGFVDPRDERFAATLNAIERELIRNGLVLRYSKDFLGSARHPFLLTSEWLAMVYSMLGRRAEAEAILGRIERCSSTVGLLGEHLDVDSCEPRGNYPHIFSHAGYLLAREALDGSPIIAN